MEVVRRTCSLKSKKLRNSFRRFSKKSGSGSATSSKGPKADKISKPKRLECYVAVAEYMVQAPGELALLPGMKVEVLEKNDIGWWFVNSEDEQGWVPSTYLEPDEGTYMASVPRALPGEEEMFVCIEDFEASGQDEVSLEKGVAVSVIQKNMDGWWLVRYQGKEAFAPGTYLKKATNASRMSMLEKSRLSGVEIVSSLQDVSTLLNTDKKDKSRPDSPSVARSIKPSVPSALIKTRSMERGGSLKPPPRQNSVKKMEMPVFTPKSSIYVTLSDFTDTVGDGVSFIQGQKVLVLEKNSTGWWLVRLGQEEGWVPASYLESYNGKMDTPSVYELASYGLDKGENTYEENDDSNSDNDGDWYTEPDETILDQRPSASQQAANSSSNGPAKRPLPEVPTESGDYEPVVEVQKEINKRPLPPLVPKGDNNSNLSKEKEKSSSSLSSPSSDNSGPPVVTKTDPKVNEKPKATSVAGGNSSSDLASVLKAKFESRTGATTENVVQSNQDEDKNVKTSTKPALPKPSDIKKFQKEAVKPSFPPTPNKNDPPRLKPVKPSPPPKSKSPNIFQNTEQKSDTGNNRGVFPKPPLKPLGSGEGNSGTKSDSNKPPTTERASDVKNMAAIFGRKPLTPKPSSSGESATPPTLAKAPLTPKPQIASKPAKPSVLSKPGLSAKPKPKPAIQPKSNNASNASPSSGNQGVSSIANALSNKLNFNNNVNANANNNNTDNNSNDQNTNTCTNTPLSSSKAKTKRFVALYDFVGEAEGEVSFNEGDCVDILEENGDWVFIQSGAQEGWAPAAYLEEI